MLPVLDSNAMRAADRHTIDELGVPSIVLMEHAAAAVVDALLDRHPEAERVVVLCGRGNNGGDGIAVGRQLHCRGLQVEVIVLAELEDLEGDPAVEAAIARKLGVGIVGVAGDDLDPIIEALAAGPDLVVDAMLGTGLDRPLGGRYATVAERVAETGVPVVAVDVPTGLSGASAEVPGPVLRAELTVTLGALKICHVLPPACTECGEVAVADIGIPPEVLDAHARLWWPTPADVARMLPLREPSGHKGRFGHLLVIAGGTGRSGAAAMAARAAVASGAGLVTMAVPEPLVPVVDGACLEAMARPLAATGAGEVDPAADPGPLDGFDVIAMGPGLGTGDGARALVERMLGRWSGPLVLDADALNVMAGRLDSLSDRPAATVLTPHPGELARLLERSTEEVVADRLGAAREAARASGCLVVAKGFRTVIAAPDGEAWVNPTGDAHLGSGGSGDVLTGTVGALLAQGLDDQRAATVACWLHGRGGELAAERWPAAVPAAELPSWIAAAWHELDREL